MRSRRWLLVLVLLAALAAAAFMALRLRAPTVPAIAVQPAPLSQRLQFSARVATQSRVDLGSTLTGRVRDVTVREGDRVQAGQLLLRLESDELSAALAQAQAAERQAEARLAGLRSGGRQGVQAALAQAEANLAAAQAELKRTRELVGRGFLSPARLDEVQRSVAVAQAQRSAAQAQVSASADSGSDAAQAQAQLGAARAATQAAQARLQQTRLVAPTAGRLLARSVEPGQIVQPGRTLLTVALEGPLQLVAQVDERFLEQLRIGQAAQAVADAFPGQPFAAQVHSLSPLIDAQRGAVEIKLSMPAGPPAFLREDMTVSVDVETARRDRTLAVPSAALRAGGDPARQAQVLVLKDGRAEPRTVTLGLRTLSGAEVLQGLAAGDVVLLGPLAKAGERAQADLAAGARLQGSKAPGEDAGAALTSAMGR